MDYLVDIFMYYTSYDMIYVCKYFDEDKIVNIIKNEDNNIHGYKDENDFIPLMYCIKRKFNVASTMLLKYTTDEKELEFSLILACKNDMLNLVKEILSMKYYYFYMENKYTVFEYLAKNNLAIEFIKKYKYYCMNTLIKYDLKDDIKYILLKFNDVHLYSELLSYLEKNNMLNCLRKEHFDSFYVMEREDNHITILDKSTINILENNVFLLDYLNDDERKNFDLLKKI